MPPIASTLRTATLGTLTSLLISGPGALPVRAVAALPSDFDGDGFVDLAIGAPYDDVGGDAGAGVVHVIYGSSTGLTSSGDQLWHQDRPGVPDSAEPGDHFGWALASADLDADGYADLAIGIPGEDLTILPDELLGGAAARWAPRMRAAGEPGDAVDAGAVYILYGGPGGLTSVGDHLFAPRYDAVSQTDMRLGTALAVGDVYGNGLPDLAMGAPGDSDGRGMVRVLDGACIGVALCASPAPYQFPYQDAGAGAGSALAIGRFVPGGKRELAIGIPHADRIGLTVPITDSGVVQIVSPHLDQGPISLTQGVGLEGLREAGDHVGAALGVIDWDADGTDTLIVGVPDEDLSGKADAGEAHFVDLGVLDQNSPGVPGSTTAGARFGASFATGSFGKGDPIDLAIGVPGWNRPGAAGAGGVVVLYGDGEGPLAAGNTLYTQDRAGIADAAEASDRFGATLFAGDLGKSGVWDLAVGVPLESVNGKARAGMVQVLYGRSSGLSTIGDQRWHQDISGIAENAQTGDRFGSAVR